MKNNNNRSKDNNINKDYDTAMEFLTLEEFMKYKFLNPDEHPAIVPYIQTFRSKYKKNKSNRGPWRKFESRNQWSAISQFTWTSDEKMVGEIIVILNKMTAKKYDWVRSSIENLMKKIKNKKQLDSLINKIFEFGYRSILSELYAKLCKNLPKTIKVGETKYYFRKLFINKCQHMFKRAISIESDDDIENSEFTYKDNVVKCITFIGELYNHGVLPYKIIIRNCLNVLITIASPNKTYIINCICDLMKTVGKKLYNNSYEETEKCFQKIQEIQKDKSYKTKERFHIMDLFDLREKENWNKK